MDSIDSNSFDKLWYCFSNSMSMEQLLKFALTSKVILSYEIDYLNSFHDRLMQGLWKRSSNGCFYKMDDRHEKLAYVTLNENYEAEVEKSLEKFRKMSSRTAAQKVLDEMSEPVLCESQIVSSEENDAHNMLGNLPIPTFISEMVQAARIAQENEVMAGAHHGFDKIPEPNYIIVDEDTQMAESKEQAGIYVIGQQIGCCTKGGQMSDAFQVFEAMPEPSEQVNSGRSVTELAVTSNKNTPNLAENLAPSTMLSTKPHVVMVGIKVRNRKQIVGLLGKNLVPIESRIARKSAKESQLLIAKKVLDELPLPSFIKEMAQVASVVDESIPMSKIAEIKTDKEGFENYVQFANETQVQQDDDLQYRRLVYTSMAILDGSISHDLTITGNLYLECPYLQVSLESFILLNNVQPTNFTRDVARLSFLGDTDWFLGSRLSMVLDIKVSKPKVFELENDWIPILNFKEAESWGIHSCCWDCSLVDSPLWELNSETRAINLVRYIVWPLLNDIDTWILMFHYPRIVLSCICLFFTHTLEDKGDFRGEEGISEEHTRKLLNHLGLWFASRTNICFVLVSYVFHAGGFASCVGQIYRVVLDDGFMTLFTWDPGIIDMIAYEQFRTSNGLRVSCRKDIILLTLWLMNYLAASSWISDVGAIRFVNFDYFESSMISHARALLLGTIEHWFITMRIMLVKNSSRNDPTIISKFSMFMKISSLVFYPGGWKYNISLVESSIFKFCQISEFFLSCYLAQSNLMENSSDCADHEVAILVFDPGGYGNEQKVIKRPKACQYGGGKQLKDKRNEDHWIYVFDPGGLLIRVGIDAMVRNSELGMYYALSCFIYRLSLILEDKDRFKRRVLIHTKNIMKGRLVILLFNVLFPKAYSLYKGISNL